MKTVIWHEQTSQTVRKRFRDVDEAHGMIQEVDSRGRVTRVRNSKGAVSDL